LYLQQINKSKALKRIGLPYILQWLFAEIYQCFGYKKGVLGAKKKGTRVQIQMQANKALLFNSHSLIIFVLFFL